MGFQGTSEEWNRAHPVGTRVAWFERPFAVPYRTRTTTPARPLQGSPSGIIEVEGVSCPVLLDTVLFDEAAAAREEPPLAGGRVGAVRGRRERADAAVLSAAYELASLSRRLATRVANGVGTTLGEEFAAHRDEVVRVLSLAASIEGTVLGGGDPGVRGTVLGGGDPGVRGTRAYLGDLESGAIYVTHYLGRDEEWSYVAPTGGDGFVVIRKGGANVVESGADLGLCPYGVGGAWHPNVWTEKAGASVVDGRSVAEMVDADSDGMEVEFDDDGGR